MHYVALVQGEERQVEITELSSGKYQVVIDGKPCLVDAVPVGDTIWSLLQNDQAYQVATEKNPKGGENLLVRGHVIPVEVLDLRTQRLRQAQDTVMVHDGPVEVTAPMPGKVVAVMVKEGQEVAEGQGLLVVEAMKMENELRAPRAGKISRLRVETGAAVEGGVPLCVVG